MYYYLLLIIAAIGTAGNFALTKIYQKTVGNTARESIVFNMLIGLFSSIVFWFFGGCRVEYTPFSGLMAFLMSLFVGVYTMIGFKIMSMGSVTVYTIFLMLGGAVVPYIYGIIFLNETVNFAKVIALLLIVAAVILNCMEKNANKQSGYFILLCIVVFLLNGATSVISKIHQIETEYAVVSADAFVLLKSIVRFLLFAVMLPFSTRKTLEKKPVSGKMYLLILASAVVSSCASVLQLIGASYLPATVLYPIMTGGTIVMTSLFDRICFAQRINRTTKLSIVICMLALILFLIE